MNFDLFNGDADGICALIQLRLAEPLESRLITGVKRDIQLLDQLSVQAGDRLTVLDISMQKNSAKVKEFLQQGALIFYVDHHQPGDIPSHAGLKTLIDTDKSVCTSLLVNRYLKDAYPLWAIAAAFGDNLRQSAEKLAAMHHLDEAALKVLDDLGNCINYNSYGQCVADLHFAPDKLYIEMSAYASPFDFIKDKRDIFAQLQQGYREDMAKAQAVEAEYRSDETAVFILPDSAWARRVSGVYGNHLANLYPNRAHAIITRLNRHDANAGEFPHPGPLPVGEGGIAGYQVSVRSPLSNQTGADEFCSAFATGGGRKAAAGINHLPGNELDDFIRRFELFYRSQSSR